MMKRKSLDIGPFAKRLSMLKEERKMSDNDIAQATGINRNTITGFLRGKTPRNHADLIAISRHFNVSIDWLLGETNHRTKKPEVREICDYTGLSSEAISVLHDLITKASTLLNTEISAHDFSGMTYEQICSELHINPDDRSDRLYNFTSIMPLFFNGKPDTDGLIQNDINIDLMKIDSIFDFLNSFIEMHCLHRIANSYLQMDNLRSKLPAFGDTFDDELYDSESSLNQYNGLQFNVFMTLKEFLDLQTTGISTRLWRYLAFREKCDNYEDDAYGYFMQEYRRRHGIKLHELEEINNTKDE